ncbi:MAG: transglycosylase domain-containing protein, partial [Bacilli bacterium]|nr:transglycosylase domain-containing protein [Bacilli bacterium]
EKKIKNKKVKEKKVKEPKEKKPLFLLKKKDKSLKVKEDKKKKLEDDDFLKDFELAKDDDLDIVKNNDDDFEIIKDEEVTPKKEKKKLFAFIKKEKKVKPKKVKGIKDEHGKKTKDSIKKPKRAWWKKVLTVILILGIAGVLSVTAFLAYVVITAPEFNDSALIIKDQTVIYDMNGNVIAKLGSEKRESVSYDALPQVLIDAIIATEDSRFFQHNGVDLFRFIKATVQQLLGHDDAGGASTLTMQTVKNNITKMDKQEDDSNIKGKIKKVIRKFQDVYLAVFKVEKEYSKEEILEMYCNDNFLGGSYYGVEEASKYYFGKSVSDLTLPEASLIAGLFQAPGRHNPYIDIDKATARRTIVLKLMVKHGYITEEERELAEKVPIESLLAGKNKTEQKYQGYIDTVVAEVEELTDTDGTGGDNPYTVPMKIYTTMDTAMQDGIDGILTNNAWYWKDEKVQAGIAVVNAETGAIVAVGAGRNKTGERQFNYATQAYRQPGSTAKPIFDYGPAIEYLNYGSGTLVMDERWSYSNGGPNVNNWDGGYYGLQTIRYHLQVSRNVPALKTFQAVGPVNSQKFAHALGLDVSLNSSSDNYHVYENGLDNTINEAYSIGGASKGFTPLDMAGAYACFANGGYYIAPHTVTKIVYRETGDEKEFKYTKERVMKDSTAYIMNNILESAVTSGFNGGAQVAGSHVAAKTGTSNYDDATMKAKGMPASAVNDLWTVAYTSQYSVAVWYGYDEADPKYYNDWGGFKDEVTKAVMQYIPKDPKGWSMPSSVVAATVEREAIPSALPSQYTPDNMKMTEYFVRGTQPTEVSERYQKLNDIKNVTTAKSGNSVTISWDFDTPRVLTKAYLESYFNKSGYGNSKAAMVNNRMNYNANTLGEVGYAIYKQAADGS